MPLYAIGLVLAGPAALVLREGWAVSRGRNEAGRRTATLHGMLALALVVTGAAQSAVGCPLPPGGRLFPTPPAGGRPDRGNGHGPGRGIADRGIRSLLRQRPVLRVLQRNGCGGFLASRLELPGPRAKGSRSHRAPGRRRPGTAGNQTSWRTDRGSTLVALRAGMMLATAAVATRSAGIVRNVTQSKALTP